MHAIEFRLDADSVQVGAYKLNGNTGVGKSIKLRSEADFSSQFRFEIRQADGWISRTIPVWNPAVTDFAFFSLSTGYEDDVNRLKTGEYYLLVKEAGCVPDEMIRADHGFVSLPCGYFNLFQVGIAPETDLSILGCSRQEKLLPFFQWADGLFRLECAADVYDVLVGTPPQVKVYNIAQFKKNEVMLIIEIAGKQSRILPSELEQSNLIDFAHYGMTIPGKGSIWVEPLCRSGAYAGKDIVERLDFVVIYESNVLWPRQLIGYNDDAEILLKSQSGYSLSFDAGQSLDSTQTTWSIPSDIHIAEGLLSVGEISIRICCKLHRANIERKAKDQANINTILWRDDLDIGVDLIAEGVANQPVEVSLGVESETSRLCTFSAFTQNGTK